MSLPQLDLAIIPSQVFWLFISTALVYWFNKVVFLPKLLGNIRARQELLHNLITEKERLEIHIKTLELEITETFIKYQTEARNLLSETMKKSQIILQEEINKIHQGFDRKTENYATQSDALRKKLETDLHLVVDDIKTQVKNFITYHVE
jgi:F0F1-type ATP synthase membrane subunit b/b'